MQFEKAGGILMVAITIMHDVLYGTSGNARATFVKTYDLNQMLTRAVTTACTLLWSFDFKEQYRASDKFSIGFLFLKNDAQVDLPQNIEVECLRMHDR